jgi:S1-C subfamily serine protease
VRYIDGREPFPWARVLPLAGLRGIVERAPRLGILSAQDAQGVRVTQVEADGAGSEAGLREGDYVLAVGSVTVGDVNFGERFRQQYGSAAEGTRITIRVRRGSQTLSLTAPLRFAEIGMRIEEDPAASVKARRVRAGILRGTRD